MHRLIFGWGLRKCPVCNNRILLYIPHGAPLRRQACCPLCMSHERHRFDVYFMDHHTDLRNGKERALLHIAPEECLETYFRAVAGLNYISADLEMPEAMEHFDLCDIPHTDCSFDIIYCSHVLEHIPNDGQAISELYRVLRPGGWAILNVPVAGERTEEDLTVTDPIQREQLYGQKDHVRLCGKDYIGRIRDNGFDAKVVSCQDVASSRDAKKMGIVQTDRILFFCKKPVVAG